MWPKPGNLSMDKYKAQLEQVNSALVKNSDNKQLIELKEKLEKILELKSKEIVDNSKQRQIKTHTSEFPLQVSEACEIFDETVKYWRPGHIVSMTLERDFYIVTFDKDKSTHRVTAVNVRRPLLNEKKSQTKPASKPLRKPHISKPRKELQGLEEPNPWNKFNNKRMKK